MIAFNDKSYGEIVLHPPPLSYLSILMLPFLFSRSAMVHIAKFFSYLMFWIENIFFIIAFFFFELVMGPFVCFIITINILKNSMGVLKTIANLIVWGIVCMPMMMILVVKDCSYLIKILCYH
jgi:hypothetical protein